MVTSLYEKLDQSKKTNYEFAVQIVALKREKIEMDKKIKKLQKDTKKLAKEESSLLKADKKRDKVCELGEEMKKKKKM